MGRGWPAPAISLALRCLVRLVHLLQGLLVAHWLHIVVSCQLLPLIINVHDPAFKRRRAVLHRQQLRGTRRIQHRRYVTKLTNDCLKRILVLLSIPLRRLHVFVLQVEARTTKAKVMIARKYEYIIGKLTALGARHCFLFQLGHAL
jgi:hypothetical protein